VIFDSVNRIIDMQEIAEICTRRVNKAIEAMDVGGQINGAGVLAKVIYCTHA
jgi:hypothetical protein